MKYPFDFFALILIVNNVLLCIFLPFAYKRPQSWLILKNFHVAKKFSASQNYYIYTFRSSLRIYRVILNKSDAKIYIYLWIRSSRGCYNLPAERVTYNGALLLKIKIIHTCLKLWLNSNLLLDDLTKTENLF